MIELEHVCRRYGATRALDDVSFTVRPGVITGFLGPNGAGKTTAIRTMVGLCTPTSGRALVGGRPYRDLPAPLRTVGTVLDGGGCHPARTARSHLGWLAAANRIPRRAVTEVLGRTGLDSVAGRRVGGFSLGMRQRLGIAAALLGDPEVLILDEPNNGLDPQGIIWLRGLLTSWAAEGRTVLVSSHSIAELSRVAEHFVVIGRGRILADTTYDELVGPHRTLEQAYLELTAGMAEFGSDEALR